MVKSADEGTAYIRSLSDEQILAAARSTGSYDHQVISTWMGDGVNPSWVTARCADEACDRRLIGEREYDYLTE